jgi:hypothetical protein
VPLRLRRAVRRQRASWEHKALGEKGWRALERDGIEKCYPQYAAQVWIYQAYLDLADQPAGGSSGLIVRPVQSKLLAADDREVSSWQLIPVVRPHLVETLCCAAQFFKYDARPKGFVVTDAP